RQVMEVGMEAILNCGAPSADKPYFQFMFRCPNLWAEMNLTDDVRVRYCHQCAKNVYYCDTSEQVEYHALNNHCVALPHLLCDEMSHDLGANITGQVDTLALLQNKLYRKNS